ncbi:MAG TPA: hypothetical protein VF351_09300 [Actinomycetota bacterium]
MRKLMPLVATLLIAAVVVGTTSLVGGAGSGGESFTIVSTSLRFKDIDVGPAGESPGDYFLEKSALWNDAETERVGWDLVQCTLDFGTTAICTVALRLFGRGQLTGTGAVEFTSQSLLFPITGGTGDFRDVTGQVRVTFETPERAVLDLHLSGTTG